MLPRVSSLKRVLSFYTEFLLSEISEGFLFLSHSAVRSDTLITDFLEASAFLLKSFPQSGYSLVHCTSLSLIGVESQRTHSCHAVLSVPEWA